jgi:hypothetical protein
MMIPKIIKVTPHKIMTVKCLKIKAKKKFNKKIRIKIVIIILTKYLRYNILIRQVFNFIYFCASFFSKYLILFK